MKRLLIAATAGLLLCACTRLVRYHHLVVTGSAGLEVTERSNVSNDSQGNPLSAAKIGLPTKSIVRGKGYTVTIHTPSNATPVVFLKVDGGKSNRALSLRGAFLGPLEGNSAMGLEGYQYYFMVDEAAGRPIAFDVLTPRGGLLGKESLRYKLTSRGHVWVTEGP